MCSKVCSKNRDRILEVARELVQTRGFNAFSYRDLADRVGIRTSSIHYYFPSKEDLGLELLRHYSRDGEEALRTILAGHPDPLQRFRAFVELFGVDACNGPRMCLAGMLSSELETLSVDLQEAVREFFRRSERLMGELLDDGRRAGVFHFEGSSGELSRLMVAALQGGMLAKRLFADPGRMVEIRESLERMVCAS